MTTAGGTSTSTTFFTYVAHKPTVTSVTPVTGTTSGGRTVRIRGTGFVGTTAVHFGTSSGTTIHTTTATFGTSLRVHTPAHVAGTVHVTVTTGAGTSTTVVSYKYVAAAPVVDGVTPGTGPTTGGTSVAITGFDLYGATAVKFGTTPSTTFHSTSGAKVTAVSPTHLAGAINITVTTAGGTSGTFATLQKFTYVSHAPTLTKLTPKTGPESGGNTVTITGTFFKNGTATVKFGGVSAGTVVVVSSTTITVKAPSHVGAGTVTVVVTTAGGSTATSTASKYTYKVTAPVITKVTPNAAPLSGRAGVVITGTHLTGPTLVVTIGGKHATVTAHSTTSLTVTAPTNTAGAKSVEVSTSGGSTTKPGAFTYYAAPVITKVTPNTAPLLGRAGVVITGTHLTAPTLVVTIGGKHATITAHSTTSLTVTAPTNTGGAKSVEVSTVGGSTTKAGAFTYYGAPTVTSVTPNVGPTSGRSTVAIHGSALTAPTLSVSVGGVPATITAHSTATLTVTVPAHTPGSYTVTVHTIGGTSNSTKTFTYYAAPSITKITPNASPLAGRAGVVITGSDLTAPTLFVTIGGKHATITAHTATSLTVTAPTNTAGAKSVEVSTVGGSTTKAGSFTYYAAPSITKITPNSSPLAVEPAW